MKGFAAGVTGTLVCIIGAVYAYFAGGFAPVATASRPMPFERKLAHVALDAALRRDMPKTIPIESNEANYLAGAHEYLINCAVCHGIPGERTNSDRPRRVPHTARVIQGERCHR